MEYRIQKLLFVLNYSNTEEFELFVATLFLTTLFHGALRHHLVKCSWFKIHSLIWFETIKCKSSLQISHIIIFHNMLTNHHIVVYGLHYVHSSYCQYNYHIWLHDIMPQSHLFIFNLDGFIIISYSLQYVHQRDWYHG